MRASGFTHRLSVVLAAAVSSGLSAAAHHCYLAEISFAAAISNPNANPRMGPVTRPVTVSFLPLQQRGLAKEADSIAQVRKAWKGVFMAAGGTPGCVFSCVILLSLSMRMLQSSWGLVHEPQALCALKSRSSPKCAGSSANCGSGNSSSSHSGSSHNTRLG